MVADGSAYFHAARRAACQARAGPRRSIVVGGAALGAALLLGALALWFHYGTAVFFEMIASGISACF